MRNRNTKIFSNLLMMLIASALLLVMSFRVYFTTVLLAAVIILIVVFAAFYSMRIYSMKLYKLSFICWIVVIVIEAVLILLSYTGYIEVMSDSDYLREIISSTGWAAPVVFILISFAQVTLVPIPSTITVMAGSYIFGLWPSVLYSLIGMIIGSMFAFFLGRVFGVKLVKWIVGEEMLKKYQNIASGKDTMLLFFMFLLPMFPDDLLCLVGGLTKMSYLKFFLIQIIGRPPGTMAVAALGNGSLSIPFSGWGIVAWIAIFAAIIGFFYLVSKYSNPLMVWFKDYAAKRRRIKNGYGNINPDFIDQSLREQVSETQVLRINDVFFAEPTAVTKKKRKRESELLSASIGGRKALRQKKPSEAVQSDGNNNT